MNRKQKFALWICIIIIVLMCLFPPWVRVVEIEGSRLVGKTFYEPSIGPDYNGWDDIHFLLSPPEPLLIIDSLNTGKLMMRNFPFKYSTEGYNINPLTQTWECFGLDQVSVDLQRLCIQCTIVVLLMVGFICSFATKIENKHKEQKSHHIPIPEVQARK